MIHRSSARTSGGFALLEAVIGMFMFAIGMTALVACIQNCNRAEKLKRQEALGRLALANKVAEIEANVIPLSEEITEELKEGFSGLKMRIQRKPLEARNEKDQEITGLYTVNVAILWESDGETFTRDVTMYVFPRRQ
jgi:Tfp pilus assembly protein PilV